MEREEYRGEKGEIGEQMRKSDKEKEGEGGGRVRKTVYVVMGGLEGRREG